MAKPSASPASDEGRSSRRACRLLALGFVLLLALVYARVLFGGQTFALDSDHLRFAIPARAQLAEALRSGRIPEWWSGVQLGVNVAGTPYYQSAYPPAWVVALFGAAYGTDIVLLGHLLLGGLGLAFWARRLGVSYYGAAVGGVLFMFGGYMSSMLVLHTAAMSPGWIPWVAWGADRLALSASSKDRRSLIWAAAAAAMPMSLLLMSGDPSAAVSGAIVGLLVAVARSERRARAVILEVGAIAFATLMSGVVLLPAALHLPETDRGGWGNDPNAWLAWSLHPLSLFQVIWPRALGDAVEPTANLARIVADTAQAAGGEPAWAYSIHFGWVALGLVVCGALAPIRGTRVLAAISLVLLIVAMGRYTPVYTLFRAVVLPERWLRYPARHLTAVVVLWSVLAATGFDWALGHAQRKAVWLTALVSLGIVAALTGLVGIWGAGLLLPLVQHGPTLRPVDASSAARAIATGGLSTLGSLVGFSAAMFGATRDRFQRWAAPLAAGAIMLQQGLEAAFLLPLVSREAVVDDPGVLAGLAREQRTDAPEPRVYRDPSYSWSGPPPGPAKVAALMGRTAAENLGVLHGLAYVPGYAPAVTDARWSQVLDFSHKDGALSKLMELFDVDYAILVENAANTGAELATAPQGFELVRRDDADLLTILRKSAVRPRAFVTSHWVTLDNDQAVIASMFSSSFDHGLVRFVDDGTDRHPRQADGKASARCDLTIPRPERVNLRCSLPTDGYAVLVDSWAPGWTATVDGAPAPIERADDVLRAVRVAPGDHHVSFAFAAPGLRTGACVSILSWLGVAVAAMFRNRRRASPPLSSGRSEVGTAQANRPAAGNRRPGKKKRRAR